MGSCVLQLCSWRSCSLSWFAFSPLIPEAVKDDLKLTNAQIGWSLALLAVLVTQDFAGNSNIISLLATLVVRIIVGPLVDGSPPQLMDLVK
jgi:MFS transporter, NNP family, nitrate/nitrite transporter